MQIPDTHTERRDHNARKRKPLVCFVVTHVIAMLKGYITSRLPSQTFRQPDGTEKFHDPRHTASHSERRAEPYTAFPLTWTSKPCPLALSAFASISSLIQSILSSLVLTAK